MKTLQNELNRMFGMRRKRSEPRKPRISDKLKAEAESAGCEIEALEGGGFNVWPVGDFAYEHDPFKGDHYAEDTKTARAMVGEYLKLKTVT